MIFLSKRPNRYQGSSTREACLSIVGLFLSIGLIGGLAGLIYGLVTNSAPSTMFGAIAFSISLFFTIIFILVIIFCLKSVTGDSNKKRHKQNAHIKHINSAQNISTISTAPNYEQTSSYNTQIYSPSVPIELLDNSTNGFGKQMQSSSLPPIAFDSLNHSNSSTNIYDLRQNYYNGH
ncbi:unnamed protein product [Adineta steineri]|uniref:Uncharacterized protein n=1 Tax=Adineta steineri TaxID=433720 RepID=A0A819LA12_9BILA|nr:unnamed protein product [Adineta steineri]CAF3962625.1 unnamed protein product [Adineta steineri]